MVVPIVVWTALLSAVMYAPLLGSSDWVSRRAGLAVTLSSSSRIWVISPQGWPRASAPRDVDKIFPPRLTPRAISFSWSSCQITLLIGLALLRIPRQWVVPLGSTHISVTRPSGRLIPAIRLICSSLERPRYRIARWRNVSQNPWWRWIGPPWIPSDPRADMNPAIAPRTASGVMASPSRSFQ